MHVSVVICTWNRAVLLDKTLGAMAQLRIPGDVRWELIVVNNNCTDETDEVIARHALHLPIRRLFEPWPGKSHAANLALANTLADLILWTDDDVLVSLDWLSQYVAAARAWLDATYFGGTVDPHFSVEPPRWIREHLSLLSSPYAIRQLGHDVRPLLPHEIPFGANMAFRRAKLGGIQFDTRLGPRERTELRGEESELIHRLVRAGHRGVWVGAATVRHYIPPERLSLDYVKRYFEGHGRTSVRQGGLAVGRTLGGVPLWVLRKHYAASFAVWALKPFQNRHWVEALKQGAVSRGMIWEFREHRLERRKLRQA